jgi:hypothetical protein
VAATRFYLPSTGAAAVAPANDSWNMTSGAAAARAAVRTKIASAMETITSDNDGTVNHTILLRQYVSEPLGAQTISGNIKGQIRAKTSAGSDTHNLSISIRACSNDGATIRSPALLAIKSETTTMSKTALTNRKFEDGSTTPIALTSLTISEGDRLVIEIGYKNGQTITTRNGGVSCGDDSASDLAQDETTTTADNPWIEFDSTLQPDTRVAISGNAGAAAIGSVLAAVVVALSGIAAAGAVGNVTKTASNGSAAIAGNATAGSAGTVAAAINPATVDAYGHAEATGTSCTLNLTVDSAATLLVIRAAGRGNSAFYTSAVLTWNGVTVSDLFMSLSLIDASSVSHGDDRLYFIANPTPGNHDLVITYDTSQFITLQAISFIGADPIVPSEAWFTNYVPGGSTVTGGPAVNALARDLVVSFESDIDIASQSVSAATGTKVYVDGQAGGAPGVHGSMDVSVGTMPAYILSFAHSITTGINYFSFRIAAKNILAGNAAAASVGTSVPGLSLPISGVAATGQVGTLGIGAALSGTAATSAPGAVGPALALAVTGQEVTGSPGDIVVEAANALSGEDAAASIGDVAADLSVALSGLEASGAVGTVTPVAPIEVALTGEAAAGGEGAVFVEISVAISGCEASGALGDILAEQSDAVAGESAATDVGSVAPAYAVDLAGETAAGELGDLAPSAEVGLSGDSAAGNVGNLTATAPGSAGLSGLTAPGQVGSVGPEISDALGGLEATGATGSVLQSVDVQLAGLAATVTAGAVAPSTAVSLSGSGGSGEVGDLTATSESGASEALTGTAAAGHIGALSPSTDVALSGVHATGALGIVHRKGPGAPIVWRIIAQARQNRVEQPTRSFTVSRPATGLTCARAASGLRASQEARDLTARQERRSLTLTDPVH